MEIQGYEGTGMYTNFPSFQWMQADEELVEYLKKELQNSCT